MYFSHFSFMKNFMLYLPALLLVCLGVSSQEVIINEVFDETSVPIDVYFLSNSNQLAISTGSYESLARNGIVETITTYTSAGQKTKKKVPVRLMNLTYSGTQNTFRGEDYNNISDYGSQYSYFKDSIRSSLFDTKDYIKHTSNNFYGANFTDNFEVFLVDSSDKAFSDLVKDDMFLKVKNIWTSKESTFPIKKPDAERLYGKGFADCPKRDYNEVSFKARMTTDKTVELITKSIDESNTVANTHITQYDLTGQLISDRTFTVKLSNGFLVYSQNQGGEMIYLSNPGVKVIKPFFTDNLSINNYYEDAVNGDVYIYGLIGKNKGMYVYNHAIGYYVFKFDKNGNKIWESINYSDDKNNFGKGRISMGWLTTQLINYNDTICFVVGSENVSNFITYGLINKETGKEFKNETSNFSYRKNYTTKVGGASQFITTCYNPVGLANKVFDYQGLVLYLTNPEVKHYLESFSTNIKVSFETFITDLGVWMVHTDGKSYYKVLYFKNKPASVVHD